MPTLKQRQIADYFLGGLLLYVIGPVTWVVGRILRRNHKIQPIKEICVIKLLGGGSLVIALPALLGLRRRYPNIRITLITTREVKAFADLLNVFDRILIIDDSNLFRLMKSAVSVLVASFRVDTFIDFEVYSRLSSVFSVLTMARNRIGFYLENTFWRKIIFTHLVFFNRFAGSYLFYEQIVRVLDALPASMEECGEHLKKQISSGPAWVGRNIVMGPGCSELGRERMLTASYWRRVVEKRLSKDQDVTIYILGTKEDISLAEDIISVCRPQFPKITWVNKCGALTLAESTARIAQANEFWGIDSALLHLARHLGITSVSYWGPTAAHTRLRPSLSLSEETYSQQTHCSPCIHVAESPPCRGNNICIKGIFEEKYRDTQQHHNVTVWYPE